MSSPRHVRAGTAADGPWLVSITPERAGWVYSGLGVLELEAGGSHAFAGANPVASVDLG